MRTLQRFSSGVESIPTSTSWYLADLGEARGRQGLFTRQSPQRLKVLREHALIESTVSSNRIEGVEVEQKRIATLVFGRPLLRDRNEEEGRGYREALRLVHERGAGLPVSEKTVLSLHRVMRGEIGDAGKYKERDGDIIERYSDGRSRIRFRTVRATETRGAMRTLLELWDRGIEERWVHPLIALAAFNLDFLCIHPFRDGNGRVSRLLLLLQTYHLGYEVGRYISLERLIEQNKERYYQSLEESSRGWHEGRHDPWPYINHVLYILNSACKEFEQRLAGTPQPRGAKTEMVQAVIASFRKAFTLAGLERACPGVSRDMIRRVLSDLRKARKIECRGRGPGATWEKR
jgi:Fic family protein